MGMMNRTTVNQRYEMERKIGDGGMAEVYLGRDLLLHRQVAVKALRSQFATDPNFRARFEREAQAAAGFTHPNIVDVYDVGEEDGAPFIVMEYVPGETLKEVIEQEGPFHPDDVAALLEQVCAALDYAHDRGYIHRDVKPQNILVDAGGVAKVVDFGIAKGLADSNLTEAGAGLGTVHYISPEQASGLMATPASDIYSAGVVAFEMLTRALPFDADTAVGVAMRHIHEPPPAPSSINPAVPPEVDAIVLRALAKDPTRRFPSAGEFARAMSDWRGYPPVEEQRSAPAQGEPVTTVVPPAAGRPAGSGATVAMPRGLAPARPAAPVVAQQARSAPRSRATEDEVGCVTWLVGSGIILGVVALIWLGFQLSPSFAGPPADSPDPTIAVTEPSANEAAGAPSTAPTALAPTVAVPAAPEALTVPVPELRGMTFDQAADAANGVGLLVREDVRVYSATVPVDAVAEQDPPAGEQLAQGETIVVKLSQGSSAVDLASLGLVGKSAEEAEALLQERNLGVERVEVGSVDVLEGIVVGVDPPATANVGDVVRLEVSVGNKVRIPLAIRGQPVEQAATQLAGLGLEVVDRVGVDRDEIEGQGVDFALEEIRDGDVVGVAAEGVEANFDAWVPRGSRITLFYYDSVLDVQ